jgi:hypothetical protein
MTRMNGNHNHNRPAVARNLFSRLISGHCRVSWEEYLPCKISYVVHIVGKPSCRGGRSDIKSQLEVSCTIVQYSTNVPYFPTLGCARMPLSHQPWVRTGYCYPIDRTTSGLVYNSPPFPGLRAQRTTSVLSPRPWIEHLPAAITPYCFCAGP